MPEDACQSKNFFLDILSEVLIANGKQKGAIKKFSYRSDHYLLKKSHPESLFSIKNQYLCLYMKIQYYN